MIKLMKFLNQMKNLLMIIMNQKKILKMKMIKNLIMKIQKFQKKEKLKLKIEDDKSIPNPTEKFKLYDLIIYCNALEKIKNNGWYYRMSEDFEKKK